MNIERKRASTCQLASIIEYSDKNEGDIGSNQRLEPLKNRV